MTKAVASFTGITRVLSCEYTMTAGVEPDIAILRIVPQGSITANYGTLVMEEDGVLLALLGCHVRFGSIRLNRNGQVVALEIEDRRWRWRKGRINGTYNVRLPDGQYDSRFLKTPRDLAKMCLAAMGESPTDSMVAELPNDRKIEVDWAAARADKELERICWELGCLVTLGIDNIPYIRRIGTGAPLTRTNAKTIAVGVTSAATPEVVGAFGDEVLVQSKLKLKAVGLDRDGGIKPIDDLAYRPSGGWSKQYENLFQDVEDPDDRALALLSVGKWYQVDSQADGSLVVPGYNGEVASIEQIFPIHEDLLESYLTGDFSLAQKAYIEGTFKLEGGLAPRRNSNAFTLLEDPFKIDGARGLVIFEHPIVKQKGDGTSDNEEIEPAELYLTCSYAVRHVDNGQTEHYYRERTIGPPGFGVELVRDYGLRQYFVGQYDGANLTDVIGNTSEVDAEADYILDALSTQFASYEVGDVYYIGLFPTFLTGVVRQASYFISNRSGCNTRLSFNGEFDRRVLSASERRRLYDYSEMAFESVRYGRRIKRGARA